MKIIDYIHRKCKKRVTSRNSFYQRKKEKKKNCIKNFNDILGDYKYVIYMIIGVAGLIIVGFIAQINC